MEIVVGQNSYFSVEEADELIQYLPFNDSCRKLWESLGDDNNKKTSIILSSTLLYDNDSMEYIGVKKDKDQSLQFPRIYKDNEIECPFNIKLGVLILGLLDVNSNDNEEESLRKAGIKSFADGSGAKMDFIENFKTTHVNSIGIDKDIWTKYFSKYSDLGKYIAI